MKQIFDWMREQIANEINEPTCIRKDYDFDDGLIHVRDLINEAEAKWESDCCEWSPMKYLEFSLSDCVTSCGHAEHYSTGIDKYCRHCGKPIKISEVE